MFTIVDGDIFDSTETYLCHQVNCVTNRAAHMAAAVFKRYPYADVYSKRTEKDLPGQILVRGNGEDERRVIGLLGQYYPGHSKYPNSNTDGLSARKMFFREALRTMSHELGEKGVTFAFPWTIGCGAAGGDWGAYITMLKEFEKNIPGDVVIYKLPEPYNGY